MSLQHQAMAGLAYSILIVRFTIFIGLIVFVGFTVFVRFTDSSWSEATTAEPCLSIMYRMDNSFTSLRCVILLRKEAGGLPF